MLIETSSKPDRNLTGRKAAEKECSFNLCTTVFSGCESEHHERRDSGDPGPGYEHNTRHDDRSNDRDNNSDQDWDRDRR
jgi:hypothetical protein